MRIGGNPPPPFFFPLHVLVWINIEGAMLDNFDFLKWFFHYFIEVSRLPFFFDLLFLILYLEAGVLKVALPNQTPNQKNKGGLIGMIHSYRGCLRFKLGQPFFL